MSNGLNGAVWKGHDKQFGVDVVIKFNHDSRVDFSQYLRELKAYNTIDEGSK